jgi:hypothetical protein
MAAIINIFAFNFIGTRTPDYLMDESSKSIVDYYMIAVLMISWIRFFSYFLVLNTIAKLTITLFRMLQEAVSFLVITTFYLLLMTSIFATSFRDCNNGSNIEYQTMTGTLR